MNGNKVYLEAPVIINTIAGCLNMTSDEVISDCRRKDYVKARHIAMYALRKFTDMTFWRIGMIFKRDHATVIYAIRSVETQENIYRAYRNELDQILNKLNKIANDDLEFNEDYKQYETEKV